MTQKNFNAKKMLMSTLAAVVFSFVFTTSANAFRPRTNNKPGVIVKASSNTQEQQKPEVKEKSDSICDFIIRMFGVRV